MSGNFGTSGEDLGKVTADMTKRLCQDNRVKHLETFLVYRLISLDKQHKVRPIGVREASRRAIGKMVMKILKKRCSKGH